MNIDLLKDLASRLRFAMQEEEYKTLLEEFNVLLEQFKLISLIENVDSVEPMTFPYLLENFDIEDDEPIPPLTHDEVFQNIKVEEHGHIKIGKVVK
jgi:aspartyl/glutamyl-tRNA(Asn/Gln) amidotransferase C subunit